MTQSLFFRGVFIGVTVVRSLRFLIDGEETHLTVSVVVELRYSACNPLFYDLESLSVTVHIYR